MKLKFLLGATMALTACGGGGGNGGESSLPAARPEGVASGVVQHGPVANATITAYDWDGVRGAVQGSTTSDSQGRYSLSLSVPDRTVLIGSQQGQYAEEATGRSVSMGEDELTAVVFYESGKSVSVQLTYYTTVATCKAQYLIEQGKTVGAAVTQANAEWSAILGIDIVGVQPVDVTQTEAFTPFLTPAHQYGISLAGLSEMVNQLRIDSNESDNDIYSVKELTALACRDVRFDGQLNGIASATPGNPSGQLYLGATPLTVDTYRLGLAQGIIAFAENENNRTGLVAQNFMDLANGVSMSSSIIFEGKEGGPVDNVGPTITARASENTLLNDSVEVGFDVTDPLGVQSVQFYIDGQYHSDGQSDGATLVWNTTSYEDGEHTIRVVATDVLNNESSREFTYVVVNQKPGISLTSARLTGDTTYQATGNYSSNVSTVDRIVVNGTEASIDAETEAWEATITLVGGANPVNIEIFDELGNSSTVSESISVDLINPIINSRDQLVTFTDFSGQLNLCESGFINSDTDSSRPLCLNAEKVSLNGAAVGNGLVSDDFIVLSIDMQDPQGQGVYSDIDKLKLEYRVFFNDQERITWRNVPRVNMANRIAWLPVTTEYFGEGFFNASQADVFTVILKVTDQVGNFDEISYTFSLDVITPVISLSRVVENENIFSVPFSSRSTVNNNTLSIKYESTPSSVPYLISINSSNNHRIEHEYESSTRENRYRVVTDEHWRTRSCADCYLNAGRIHYDNIVHHSEHAFTDWQEVDGFNKVLDVNYNTAWQAKPSPVYGAYQAVSQDTVQAPSASNWQSVADYNTGYCKEFRVDVDGHNTLKSMLKRPAYNILDALGRPAFYARCDKQFSIITDTAYSFFQKRNTHSVEYQAGYPRNNVQHHGNTVPFNSSRIRVINEKTFSEIFPDGNGWYRIPSDTAFSIVKEVTIPAITKYDDGRVATNDASVPYGSTIHYDKRINWVFDTKISVTRAIDSGNDNSNDVSTVSAHYGEGVVQYSLSR